MVAELSLKTDPIWVLAQGVLSLVRLTITPSSPQTSRGGVGPRILSPGPTWAILSPLESVSHAL